MGQALAQADPLQQLGGTCAGVFAAVEFQRQHDVFQGVETVEQLKGLEHKTDMLGANARALIFIEADNPDIGLMCVMPVGMAEVSSCDITVQPGQHVEKGDELGMFHFGGSTHCLIFRPGVNLVFTSYEPSGLSAGNVRVNAELAVVRPASRA